MKIHHVGYLVKTMDKAISTFEKLGFTILKSTIFDEYRKINICFIQKDGYVLELVSPTSRESIAYGLLKQYRNSPYHICYVSDDLDKDVVELSSNGYVCIDEPRFAPALEHKRVVFLMNSSIGLIELVEE